MIRDSFLKKWEKYLRADEWDKWGAGPDKEVQPGGFRAWGHGAYQYVADLIPKDAHKVLELGCADGWMVHLMKEKGLDATGLTYAQGEYDCCKERGLPVILGDMHDIPMEDNSVDAVVSRQTLEHATCLYVVLWECDRIVKPGGYLVTHVPRRLDGIDDNEEHLNTLTPLQWTNWVTKHTNFKKIVDQGFEDEQDSFWFIAKKEGQL